ncbi:hypothetical protein [Mycobacteroides abscessus]|uniref:hypothetical protein n=1 Tax=Mycobacteroides abscessus TaxID=36809 RepID=UPI000C2632E5|nr:hypothetical protein [Mycobacteroides abscessus]
MAKRSKFRRLDPYVAPPSATFAYLAAQREQAVPNIVLDPRQNYAAIRVRRLNGEMTWIIAREPATLMDTWGEVMFMAGIDCSSAAFLIATGAQYFDEDRSDSCED